MAAVELLDRAALRSVEDKPGMPEAHRARWAGRRGAAGRDARGDAAALAAQIGAIEAALADAPHAPSRCASRPTRPSARGCWNVRKGMFPAVGAMRRTGTTVIIEDVAFPIERLAEATLDLQRLLRQHGYPEAIIFGHALEGNLHFVFTQDFDNAAEVERYRGFMDELCHDGRRQVRRLAQGRARHRPQHGAVRRDGMGRGGVRD